MIVLADGLLTLATLGGGAGLASVWALDRQFDRAAAPATAAQPVTLLRPLHGNEPGLAARLAALVAQDFGAPVQLVCGVQRNDDPAIAVVRALQAAQPELDIALVIDACRHGSNHKVSNLINMMAAARHDVLVLSDSDILVTPDWLQRITAALGQPGVGAVTALYTGYATVSGMSSRLAAMAVSYQFLHSVALGLELGLALPCMGSTIALTRSTLERIGGFAAVADELADDYEIGRAVRALGLTVAVPALLVGHAHRETNLAQLWRQESRWARTIRAIDGSGHGGQGVTFFLPLALLGALAAGFAPIANAVLVAALAVRLLQKQQIDRMTAQRAGPVWLLPLRDSISLAVWAASYFVRNIEWRGMQHRLGTGGVLLEGRLT